MCALQSDHYPLFDLSQLNQTYDIGIIILPKKHINDIPNNIVKQLKKKCNKIGIMQEGPNWYWQDYEIENQIRFYQFLVAADFILCHNISDVQYYKGLLHNYNHIYNMPSLLIEDLIKDIDNEKRKSTIMLGGNLCSWYGGYDSWVVGQYIEGEKCFIRPSMGRMDPAEKQIDMGVLLDYTDWYNWMYILSQCRYGIHMMRTHAAGTFALNCAYFGIPCIGYEGLDTQESCHPSLTVKMSDLKRAGQLAKQLSVDDKFYEKCSTDCRENYKNNWTENIWLEKMNRIFEGI